MKVDPLSAPWPDRRIAAGIFLLSFVTYAYFFGGSGFNQNATFGLTRAIVEQRSLAIDRYASNTGDISFHEGRVYSNKAPGTSFLAVIPYALLYAIEKLSGLDVDDPLVLTLNLYLCTVAVCSTTGALIPFLLFLEARRRQIPRRWSLIIALIIAFGTPVFAYSTMLFVHVPSAALVLLSFLAVTGEKPRPLAGGLWIGLAGLLNYLCIPLALIFGTTLLARTRRARDFGLFLLGGLPSAVILAAYQFAAFGAIHRTSVATTNPAFLTEGAWLGVIKWPSLEAFIGITVSPYRGLLYLSPILLLALIGIWLSWRKGWLERSTILCIVASTTYMLLANSSFNGWHGGYSIGPRYLIPIVPLMALLLLSVAGKMRVLWIALGALSLVLNFAATVVDPQPPDILREPLGRYALPALLFGSVDPRDVSVPVWIGQFYTGHVGTNRVAADEILPFKKHLPGSPASEWASFNLGEMLFETGSALSLIPILIWMVGGAVILWRKCG